MTIHHIKCLPEFFERSKAGLKNYEIRKNDRDYKVGDILVLEAYDLNKNIFLGEKLERKVEYILPGGQFGIDPEYVILELGIISLKS